jgi:hypothetical protein
MALSVFLAGWLLALAGWLLALPVMAGTAPVVRSVAEFGAKGDGASPETGLLQGAIDACAAGGGCVLAFPAGRYVSGTLYLRDNVTLRLDPGAVLATSGRAEDYTAPALLYGKGVNAVTLTGEGEIQAGPVPAPDETTIRNPGSKLVSLVLLENATNVRESGVRFLRSPAWTITLRVVDGAWIENVLIDNAMLAPNTSGLVIDSSTRVSVRGLHFRGGGDGITLQTSLVDGIAPPCSEITIADSTLRSGSMAMKIGTATYGDIRNVTVNGVVVEASQGGVGVFVRDGATVENLQFSSLMIETAAVRRGRAEWPIVLDVKRRAEGGTAGQLRGVRFSNTQVTTAGKLLFSGMAGRPIRDLELSGLTLRKEAPATAPLNGQRPWKSTVDSVAGEDESASAMLFGYVADSLLDGVQLIWETTEPAPESHALFAHSVDGLRLDGVRMRQGKVGGSLAAMQFMSSRRIEIRNSTAPPQTGVWLQAQGVPKQEFFLFGNNTAAAYRDLVFVK